MKKGIIVLFLIAFLAPSLLAMDVGGKLGLGLRASAFNVRKFINNNWAVDLSLDYWRGSQTGETNSNQINGSVGLFYVREIFASTLFEAGSTLQNWQGTDNGSYYSAVSFNPFIGIECFVSDHVAIDGKLFLGAYNSQMEGAVRKTNFYLLSGNLGAHIYL